MPHNPDSDNDADGPATKRVIQQLRELHHAGSRLHHWSSEIDQIPHPPQRFAPTYFVFAFFVFNSIYSEANWQNSFETRSLRRWHRQANEPPCQHCGHSTGHRPERKQIKMLIVAVTNGHGNDFPSAFRSHLVNNLDRLAPLLDGLGAAPNRREILNGILSTRGTGRNEVSAAESIKMPEHWSLLIDPSGSVNRTEYVEAFTDLVLFIYKVRCRMFHGAKGTVQIRCPDQHRRFIGYTAILLATTDAFFEAADKTLAPEARINRRN